ncbi:CIA30 family protein [Nitrincola schmidtii]|uniref:CIA30 family protein n=1 Tax=Nitrincola schmidtii TaxID=1730894 RepID=UPI00124C5F82|nr:CIA30 family protein [Nitrincola schmidtii]
MALTNAWHFFTDQVMGGISSGQISHLKEEDEHFVRMAGNVSTDNRGGFIQMRQELVAALPENTQGIRIIARGNQQQYFVHLKTRGSLLPWQFYQSGFEVTEQWQEIHLPLKHFSAKGSIISKSLNATSIKSVAIAAYGRDHEALIDLKTIDFY